MGHYRVRAKRGDAEVEVDSSDKAFTEEKLEQLLGMLRIPRGSVRTEGGEPHKAKWIPSSEKPLSMVEHVRLLAPKSGTQTVVAVGDYLERFGGMSNGFKTRDIADGFRTVKFKHTNPSEAVRSAKGQGFLMDGREPGTWQLTQTAEAWVKGQLTGSEDA